MVSFVVFLFENAKIFLNEKNIRETGLDIKKRTIRKIYIYLYTLNFISSSKATFSVMMNEKQQNKKGTNRKKVRKIIDRNDCDS